MLFVSPITELMIQRGENHVPEGMRRDAVLQEMEHLFAFQLLQELRQTVQKGELLNGGHEQEMYEEMLDDILSGHMAESGQLGIAEAMADQLRVQEMQQEIRRTMVENKTEFMPLRGPEPKANPFMDLQTQRYMELKEFGDAADNQYVPLSAGRE